MNPLYRNPFCFLLVLLFFLSFSCKLGAADPRSVSVALEYTPTDGPPRTAVIPRAWISDTRPVTIPLKIAPSTTWVVEIALIDELGTFTVFVTDPEIHIPTGILTILSADFKQSNGKPVTVLKSSESVFEVTIAAEQDAAPFTSNVAPDDKSHSPS